jgi:hypothetical protein
MTLIVMCSPDVLQEPVWGGENSSMSHFIAEEMKQWAAHPPDS